MNNATLIYKIQYNNSSKELKLENQPLYLIDKITSNFKNDDDFINHYYNKERILNFIKDNGNTKGNVVIDYKKDVYEKEELKPLYDIKDIVIKEDLYNNNYSELEKARKLLFNSKNQIFARIILKSNIFKEELNRYIDLNEEEVRFATINDIEVKYINKRYFVSFKSLLVYRINNKKLGYLRNAYHDMLNILKKRITEKDNSTIYYFNRELRLLIDCYKELINNISVKNVRLYGFDKRILLNYRLVK